MTASFRRSARGVGPEEDAEAEGQQPRGTVVEKAGCVAAEGTGGAVGGRRGLRAGPEGRAPSRERGPSTQHRGGETVERTVRRSI